MATSPPTADPHPGRAGHTWLHLVPHEPTFIPGESALLATETLLVESGLAVGGDSPGTLLPGPNFARLLLRPGYLPLAGRPRGEVRLEVGVLRCYPDPGPDGFATEPPRSYRAACPDCASTLDFFRLRFPGPDAMTATCDSCLHDFDVSRLHWTPRLPVARTELTFGDLDGRPTLAGSDFLDRLEQLWATPIDEVHVTL
ncbi:MAG TPA: hypothetical protein VNH20_01880 [Candidatus Dormibacteraeota bacterium]|nr:hypothetical protein [Candidatus Dormibacteraeota bacterium]